MDRTDELGYRAWDEFYIQMERRFRISRGRGQYWQNRHLKAFRKIGEKCLKHGIDPTDYINVSFDVLEKNHQYITPKDFSSGKALNRYLQHRSAYADDVLASWVTQVNTVTDMECRLIPKLYANEEDILMNMAISFDAWFRILYPSTFSDRLYAIYGQQAWTELHANRKLCEFLRERRPANVKELESRIGDLGDGIYGAGGTR